MIAGALCTGVLSLAQAENQVRWQVLHAGFATSISSDIRVLSAVGQSLVGRSVNPVSIVISGFLVDTAWNMVPTGLSNQAIPFPASMKLQQNYPNPFNPATTIQFTIPAGIRDVVSLQVFDVLGREVATLVNEEKEAGSHEVTWDATGIASGVYLYRLQAGGYSEARKLVLMR
jgi:hypothetical protein